MTQLERIPFNGGFPKGEVIILGCGSTSFAKAFFAIKPLVEEKRITMQVLKPRSRTFTNVVEIQPKQHKRRRNQTEAYHKKVQKRWDKRFKTEAKFQVASQPKVFSMSDDLCAAIGYAFASFAEGEKRG